MSKQVEKDNIGLVAFRLGDMAKDLKLLAAHRNHKSTTDYVKAILTPVVNRHKKKMIKDLCD